MPSEEGKEDPRKLLATFLRKCRSRRRKDCDKISDDEMKQLDELVYWIIVTKFGADNDGWIPVGYELQSKAKHLPLQPFKIRDPFRLEDEMPSEDVDYYLQRSVAFALSNAHTAIEQAKMVNEVLDRRQREQRKSANRGEGER